LLWFESNKENDQDSIFIHSESGNAKADKTPENEAKKKRSRDGIRTKNVSKPHFGYKVHRKIDRNHKLIRRFKTKISSFHDSQVDLLKNFNSL
jgi:hypothetical protein